MEGSARGLSAAAGEGEGGSSVSGREGGGRGRFGRSAVGPLVLPVEPLALRALPCGPGSPPRQS